jgi:NAD(P)-dependent dehydrogenase (short-subunit alcohol dehydrogenase family)
MFEDKVAVITGAANGIGRSVALALAGLGADIVVADIDDTALSEVRREIEGLGRRALAVHCDVSKDADVDNLATQAFSAMGKVDVLMNNAGIMITGFLEKLAMADWDKILGINLLGSIRGVRAFLPHMLERGSGYIINTSSAAGLVLCPPHTMDIAYMTSKFGLVGFSGGLAAYLRPKGIMVSLLCPGLVSTGMHLRTHYVGFDQKAASDIKRETEKMFETPGVKSPDEVAQMVVAAMQEKRFLILTDPSIQDELMERGYDVQKLEKYIQDIYNV